MSAPLHLLLLVYPRNPYCQWYIKTTAAVAGIKKTIPADCCRCPDRCLTVTRNELSRIRPESLPTAFSQTGTRIECPQIIMNSFGCWPLPTSSARQPFRRCCAVNCTESGTTRNRKRVPTALQETPPWNSSHLRQVPRCLMRPHSQSAAFETRR